MLEKVVGTTIKAVTEIIRGIDNYLKYEKTPKERFTAWAIILVVVSLVVLFIVRELGSFVTNMINSTNSSPRE